MQKALIGSQTTIDDLPFSHKMGGWIVAFLSYRERFFVMHQPENVCNVIYGLNDCFKNILPNVEPPITDQISHYGQDVEYSKVKEIFPHKCRNRNEKDCQKLVILSLDLKLLWILGSKKCAEPMANV